MVLFVRLMIKDHLIDVFNILNTFHCGIFCKSARNFLK
jgi:hypothetical protein